MKIAVEGCAHGELEKIYETITEIEKRDKIKIDLLLCCGDFQATRNMEDLQTMAVPQKFQHMCTFYKYGFTTFVNNLTWHVFYKSSFLDITLVN